MMDLTTLHTLGLLPDRCDYCDSRRCAGECIDAHGYPPLADLEPTGDDQ